MFLSAKITEYRRGFLSGGIVFFSHAFACGLITQSVMAALVMSQDELSDESRPATGRILEPIQIHARAASI
jgi:hypothetical protein